MKARLVSALSASLVAYCLFAITWGATGLKAASDARSLVDRMDANIEELERRNRYLGARLDWLSGDPEALRLEARELGVLERGATLVRLPARSEREDLSSTGTLVAWEPAEGMGDADLKLAGMIAGLALFFASLLVPDSGARKRKDRAGLDHPGFRLEGKTA